MQRRHKPPWITNQENKQRVFFVRRPLEIIDENAGMLPTKIALIFIRPLLINKPIENQLSELRREWASRSKLSS